MKRVVALLLASIVCLTLCACSEKEQNPLVTTWKVGNEAYEETVVFTENKGEITGHLVYYNYGEETWGEENFIVKEQTDEHIIALYDDGTMRKLRYWRYGDILWLDGVYYADLASETVTPETAAIYTIVFSKEYSGITLGQSLSEVNLVLGTTLETEESNFFMLDYRYSHHCPTYAQYDVREGDVYSITLGFDENSELVHFRKQGDGEKAYSKLIYLLMLPDKFLKTSDEYETDSEYTHERYRWYLFGYVMEYEIVMDKDTTEPYYYTLTWYVAD